MSSASFPGCQVAAITVRTNDMTAKEVCACVNLGVFMGLPREKLHECLVKSRIDELTYSDLPN